MKLRNMLKICLVFWKSEPQYAYKRYAYKRKNMYAWGVSDLPLPICMSRFSKMIDKLRMKRGHQ